MKFKTYNFIGLVIDAVTYEDLFELVDTWLKEKNKRSHHIAVINAYCATMALKDPEVARVYSQADLIGPDGMPFVYWMRWFLHQPCDQFDASSLVINLAEKSKEKGYTFYLYGGHPEVLEKMKENLERSYPYLKILGYSSPPFRMLTEEEDKEICDEINRLKPDILCIGLGTPKQDFWIDEHIHIIKGTVMIPCGAIFDFFGGRIKKAPKLITKVGLEWLYRLFSKDFKRLWYRYTVLNIIFLWNFILQFMGLKIFKSQRENRADGEER